MTTVLVVNHAHSAVCGVHGMGRRMAVSLAENPSLDVAYADCADANQYVAACETHRPDAVLVNYRPDLMGWVRAALAMYPNTIKLATVHNYDLGTVDTYGREPLSHGFDRTLVLDPTVTPRDPRPTRPRPAPSRAAVDRQFRVRFLPQRVRDRRPGRRRIARRGRVQASHA
jgi:hypothetical protein